jgi:hypothetical protein
MSDLDRVWDRSVNLPPTEEEDIRAVSSCKGPGSPRRQGWTPQQSHDRGDFVPPVRKRIPLSGRGGTPRLDKLQVASCGGKGNRKLRGAHVSYRSLGEEDIEEGEIESFFGQLWWFPKSPSPRVRHSTPNLFWVRQDLWKAKSF